MTGKKIILLTFSLLVAVGMGGGAVLWSLVQVPDFYEEALAAQSDPLARQQAADTFVQRTVQLANDIKHADAWSQEFTVQQVNAWLAEQLHKKYAELVPSGIRDPRMQLDGQSVLVGFHYEQENWSGIVSLRLRPWVPEPNQLAIEIESIRAGLLPIPLDNVLEQLSEQIEIDGWQAEWTQVNGNDVLLVRFDSNQADQPLLEAVQVTGNSVRISGSRSAKDVQPDGQSAPDTGPTFNVPRVADHSGEK
jgi:uncharacterized protein YpmS